MRLTTFVLVTSISAIGSGALLGCDQPYADQPAIDPNAPRVHIATPERGTFAGDVHEVEVTGTATDDELVTSVEVNGVTARVLPDGTFTATVPVAAGTNLLHAVASDAQGNLGKETRAVVAGPTVSLDRTVAQAITATISAQTFDAIARGASTYLTTADLTTAVAGSNPVLDIGSTNGQPDCLYAQAAITLLDIGNADIQLVPTPGGLMLDATLDDPTVALHLQWSVSCLDGSKDVTVTANRIHIAGLLSTKIDIHSHLDFELQNPDVTIDGFAVDMGGVPQAIIDMLDLDTKLGPVLAFAVEKLVVPMLNNTLASLDETKTLDVFGRQVDVTVTPSRVDFDATGAVVILDSELRAQNDTGDFVFVPNTLPAMDTSHGFQLAVSDDAANQLLTSLWSAKALDVPIDLQTGPYGEIGKLYDRVELTTAAPPYLDASGDHLKLVVGDLIASFVSGEEVVTKVAINAEVALDVKADQATGALRLDVGDPTAYVDILDDGVVGANSLSNAEFEAITSFALARVVAVGSGALGAIPLPSAGGVAVAGVSVSEQVGYLVVAGEVQ